MTSDLEDRQLCPHCGWICDDEDCECPDTCFTRTAVENSRPFSALEQA